MTEQEQKAIAGIVDRLRDLEPELRLEVFARFCHSCGCDDPSCQCWNDE